MAADDAGLAGQLIASRYRIGNRIGEGGMGVVYAAFDEQLRRQVAVKFLPSASQADDDRLGRFRNEARTLSALNHPHIVTIFEIGQTETTPFIAMELGRGRDAPRAAARRPLAAARCGRHRVAGRARPRCGSCEGHRPSRHQARERDDSPRRLRQSARFRRGHPARTRARQRNPC